MTSNIGSQQIQSMSHEPYEAIKATVMEELKNYFRPEFVNRVDEVVVFHGLDQAQIRQIAKIQLKRLELRLRKMDLNLQVSAEALDLLSQVGFDPVYGARPLKRAIQQYIENPLAKAILNGDYLPEQTILIEAKEGEIVFE
jgi:ATP-dependent Clp protease ATP-binding subunit ClpB